MRHRHIPLLLALLVPFAVSAGQVFEWKDASGKTHFSDQPPLGVDAKPIGIKTTAPKPSGPPAGGGSQSAVAPKTWAEKAADSDKRKAENQENTAKAKEEAERKQRMQEACESAKRELQLLQSGVRVQRLDEKGERIVLDDAAREEEMARVRENMKRVCEN